jgi:hypothetical protein
LTARSRPGYPTGPYCAIITIVPDEQRPNDVLGALPRTRPHRRSDKRKPQGAAAAKPARAAKTTARAPKAGATPKASKTAPAKAKAKPVAKATTPRKPAPLRGASAKPKSKPERLRQPAQPAGTPARGPASARPPAREAAPATRRSGPPSGGEIFSTAVQAAAELAEIGLTASARALRNALSRLPRP